MRQDGICQLIESPLEKKGDRWLVIELATQAGNKLDAS
jgi:hypothetical protein